MLNQVIVEHIMANATSFFSIHATGGHSECIAALIAISLFLFHPIAHFFSIHETGGHSECIAALVAAGADVNLCDVKAQTPLFSAIASNHLECARLLLQAGKSYSLFFQTHHVDD